jgi:hypothetical protein
MHALKGLACRARVTPASSHASTCPGKALTSSACHACGCASPFCACFCSIPYGGNLLFWRSTFEYYVRAVCVCVCRWRAQRVVRALMTLMVRSRQQPRLTTPQPQMLVCIPFRGDETTCFGYWDYIMREKPQARAQATLAPLAEQGEACELQQRQSFSHTLLSQ